MTKLHESVATVDGLIEAGEAFRLTRAGAGPHPSPARRVRVFHAGMAVAFIVTTFAGFAPTYFLRGFTGRPPLGALLHVHGLVFTSWLFLVLAQTLLVARRRVDLHRRLGVTGAVLAAVMVPLGIYTGIVGARLGEAARSPDALPFLIFPLGQMIMFGAAMGAAIWHRRTPAIHRRLVVLATAIAVTPAISRLPFVPNPLVALVLSTAFVIAGAIHDRRTQARIHPLYIGGGLLIVLSGPVRFVIGHSEPWLAFARVLVG